VSKRTGDRERPQRTSFVLPIVLIRRVKTEASASVPVRSPSEYVEGVLREHFELVDSVKATKLATLTETTK